MVSTYDLVIRGGTVYDGTGAPGARADVGVRGDRITGVGTIAERGGAELDAAGLAVSPGFIDVHNHDDLAVLCDPQMAFKVLQGVTTDVGVPAAGSKPHPRLYGCFPRVLGHYVRDERVLELATAIHRMTGMAAAKFRLADRGVIMAGAFADLVVFDPARIRDTATYDDPRRFPDGIRPCTSTAGRWRATAPTPACGPGARSAGGGASRSKRHMATRNAATGGQSASSAGFAGAISGLLASDARGPARGRPAARTASWGEVRKGGGAPLRVPRS